MPTIKKIEKKPRENRIYPKTGKSLDIAHLYNSQKWVKLRKAYYQEHPLCEQCLEEGKVVPAEEVHHIRPISTGIDELEMASLAYNPENLMSLCSICHDKIHTKMKREKHK